MQHTDEPTLRLRSGVHVRLAAIGLLESLLAAGYTVAVNDLDGFTVEHPTENLHPDCAHMLETLEAELVAVMNDDAKTRVH